MVGHMPPPGKRLVAYAQTPFRRSFTQLCEVGGRPVDPAKACGMNRRTDQDQIGAKLLHKVELALGPVERLAAQGLRQAFKVAEGLKQRDLQPVVSDHPPHVARRSVVGQKILFEDFDPIETGACDRFQLLVKRARDRNGGDRRLHGCLRPKPMRPRFRTTPPPPRRSAHRPRPRPRWDSPASPRARPSRLGARRPQARIQCIDWPRLR